MAGINRTTGKATDLITFSRASGGTALRKINYGPELVTNGTFDTDLTGWTAGTGLALWNPSGYLDVDRNGGNGVNVASSAVSGLVAGKVYRLTFDIIAQTNRLRMYFGASSIITTSGKTGTIEILHVAASTSHTLQIDLLDSGTATATLDNISVKEVLFDQPDGTLTLFNHPTNTPRIEYDAAGNVKGLLVEEARTNSAPESNGWAGAGFQSGLSTTLTANYGTSPDGTQNSTRVQFSGGAVADNRVEDIITGTFASLTHTVSCWMRSTDGSNQIARLKCTHGGVSDYFSLDQTVTGDWQRFSFTQAFGAGGTSVVAGVVNGSAGGSADIEVYGLQVELNASFPTSYIPTSGATATRAADIASISVDNFGYNQKAYTIAFEMALIGRDSTDYPRVLAFGNQTGNLSFYCDSSSIYYDKSGTGQLMSRSVSFGVFEKFAATAGIGGGEFHEGIPQGFTSTTTEVDGNISTVWFGSNSGANNYLNGHIKSIAYYPRRLSNAQLQALTA